MFSVVEAEEIMSSPDSRHVNPVLTFVVYVCASHIKLIIKCVISKSKPLSDLCSFTTEE